MSRTPCARSAEFDLVHNQLDWLPLAFDGLAGAPSSRRSMASPAPGSCRPTRDHGRRFVAISDSDRSDQLDYVATVHHGIDLEALPFRASPGDHLVSFGRVHPDKGTADAIDDRPPRRSATPDLRDRSGRALF